MLTRPSFVTRQYSTQNEEYKARDFVKRMEKYLFYRKV